MPNRDFQALLDYHEGSKHSARSVRASSHFLDWDIQPLPFKIYRGLARVPLPSDPPATDVPALAAITGRIEPPRGERIPDLAALARLLFLAAGITKRRRHPGGEIAFRAHPNTGALYHIDLYVVCGDLADLGAGVYHFGPHDFALHRLREGDFRAVAVEASGRNPDVARAPVVLASASTYWRNAWKYQGRAYRHCFWDAGTLHANLLAAAAAERLEPRVVMGFAGRAVEALLALDPLREGALTLVPLGRSDRPAPAAPAVAPIEPETEPLSPEEVDYPEIRAAHAASFLDDGAEAAAWRGATPDRVEPAAVGAEFPLAPAAPPSLEPLASLIRRRGSTRAFDPARPISLAALSAALDCATCGVPADFLDPPGASLLDFYLIANAVDGLPAGAYHYRRGPRALELLREGDFRGQAGRLGLGQQLPAHAAVNVYSLADLPRTLERFGNRGYGAAQLEGGIAGGRMYLAAYAARCGATGLTFFDDEVTDFFSPHAAGKSVMFLIAMGRPDLAALGVGR